MWCLLLEAKAKRDLRVLVVQVPTLLVTEEAMVTALIDSPGQTRNGTLAFRYKPPIVARLQSQSTDSGSQEGREIVTVRISGAFPKSSGASPCSTVMQF